MQSDDRQNDLDFRLGERTKELNALHQTARILQDDERPLEELLARVVELLPGAWQYPETTVARVRFDAIEVFTPGFAPTAWMQRASFTTRTGERGSLEVAYLTQHPPIHEGPFLAEERDLIDTLAEMLRSCCQRRLDILALERTRDELEIKVADRTAELARLASELSRTEARQRRTIAMDLHDHIGQALAFIRIRIAAFRGDAMFCGFDANLGELLRLLDQTITYTRDLTFEISPPVLYELGLESALEWLAEHLQAKHGLQVTVDGCGPELSLDDDRKETCFKCVGELLTNTVKHSGAQAAKVTLRRTPDHLRITVEDDGAGFTPDALTPPAAGEGHFGLFSVRERIRWVGGETAIRSAPGAGAAVTFTLPLDPEAR